MVYFQKETALLPNYNRQFSGTTSEIFRERDTALSLEKGINKALLSKVKNEMRPP